MYRHASSSTCLRHASVFCQQQHRYDCWSLIKIIKSERNVRDRRERSLWMCRLSHFLDQLWHWTTTFFFVESVIIINKEEERYFFVTWYSKKRSLLPSASTDNLSSKSQNINHGETYINISKYKYLILEMTSQASVVSRIKFIQWFCRNINRQIFLLQAKEAYFDRHVHRFDDKSTMFVRRNNEEFRW